MSAGASPSSKSDAISQKRGAGGQQTRDDGNRSDASDLSDVTEEELDSD